MAVAISDAPSPIFDIPAACDHRKAERLPELSTLCPTIWPALSMAVGIDMEPPSVPSGTVPDDADQ